MKKVLAAVLTVAFLFSVANAAVDLGSGFSLYGDGSIFIAGIADSPKDDDKSYADGTDYRIDLYLSKTFENDGKAVVRIRDGKQSKLTLGSFRPGINDAGNDDDFKVKEFYYTQPLFDNFVAVTFGKLGALDSSNALGGISAFFTNDVTIITPVEIGFKTADAKNITGNTWGSNPFTVKIAVNPIDLLTVTYAYSSGLNTDRDEASQAQLTSDGYNAVELNFKPIEKGNYRVAFWMNNYKSRDFDSEDQKKIASGLWLSLDQQVADGITLYGRLGYRLDKTEAGKRGSVGTAGQMWQFGGKIGGAFWSRDNDSIFLAIGQANNVKETYGGVKYSEIHAEINYSIAIDSAVSIAPVFEYVQALGDVDTDKFSGFAYGIKTSIKF